MLPECLVVGLAGYIVNLSYTQYVSLTVYVGDVEIEMISNMDPVQVSVTVNERDVEIEMISNRLILFVL